MAKWIGVSVIGGYLDNFEASRLRGRIWFLGQAHALEVDLTGPTAPDLAGRRLRFFNAYPMREPHSGELPNMSGRLLAATASQGLDLPLDDPSAAAESVDRQEPELTRCRVVWLSWQDPHGQTRVLLGYGWQCHLSAPLQILPESTSSAKHGTAGAATAEQRQQASLYLQAAFPDAEAEADTAEQPDTEDTEDTAIEKILEVVDMKEEIDRRGGTIHPVGEEPLPVDAEHAFLRTLLIHENAPEKVRREMLEKDGWVPPAMMQLDGDGQEEALWDLVYALARHRQFLMHTDHLNTHDLLKILTEEVIEETTAHIPFDAGWNCHIDLSEYSSPAGDSADHIWLKYYAGELDRPSLAEALGEPFIPDPEPLPYDRDRHLPKPYPE